MKVTLTSIHPRITTSRTLAPPDGIINLTPIAGGRFQGEVEEEVAAALVAISRKDEFVIVPKKGDAEKVSATSVSVSPSATPAPAGKESLSPAAPSPSSSQSGVRLIGDPDKDFQKGAKDSDALKSK